MKSEKNKAIKNKPEINLIEVRGDFKVHLKWDKADGAEKYNIVRSANEKGPYSKVIQLPYDITYYTDSSITQEGRYWYKVIAYKKVDEGKLFKRASRPMCANITSIQLPVLEKVTNNKNNSIEITWNSNEKVTSYRILRRFDFMKRPMVIAKVDSSKNSYTDKNVVKGQLFYYSVQSIVEEESDIRYSNPSRELCNICFDKVKVLEVKRKHRKNVTLSLRLTAGADGYILYKSDSENGKYTEVSRTDSISSLICSDKGNKGEKAAYYKVACYKKCGGSEFYGPMSESVYVKYKI